MSCLDPPPSRKYAAALAGEELASARGWRMMWTGHALDQAASRAGRRGLVVLSLVKAARRALLSAEGYQVERALAVLDQWMEDAAERTAV